MALQCNVEGLDRPVVVAEGIFNKPIEDSRRTMSLYIWLFAARKLWIVSLQCTKELSEIKLNISKCFF